MPLLWEQMRKRAIHEITLSDELYDPLVEDIMPFVIRQHPSDFQIGDVLHISDEKGKRQSWWFIQIVIVKCAGLCDDYCLLGITGPWGHFNGK